MILVEDIDKSGACETAEQLCNDVWKNRVPGELAGDGKTDGQGGVEMSPGVGACDEDAAHDGETPSESNHDPSATVSLGFFKGICSAYAVTEQYQDQSSEKLEKTFHQ